MHFSYFINVQRDPNSFKKGLNSRTKYFLVPSSIQASKFKILEFVRGRFSRIIIVVESLFIIYPLAVCVETRVIHVQAVPGPGRYDIRSQFRTDPSADGTGQNEDEREEETEDAPFGSREKVSCLKQFTYIQYMYTYCLFIGMHQGNASTM